MKLTKEQETEKLKATNLELQELVRKLTVELDNKNRELEIESSLERIRSHAMAMRDSGDLSAAAGIVFSELKKLGIHPFRSGVGLLTEEPHKALLYAAMEGPDYDALVLVGPIDLSAHKCMALQYESCIKEENYFPVLTGKEFQSYIAALADQIPIPSLAESQFRQTHYGYYFPFKEGYFYTWTETPYTRTEISLLERFKAIIALTFRRYLDLRKAEAQAREATIETALERVRSKSMAMHSSNELKDVITIVIEQFKHLGFNLDLANFNYINNNNRDWIIWLATPDKAYPEMIHLPYIKHPLFDTPAEAFKKGLDFISDTLTKEEKDSAMHHMYETSIIKDYDTDERRKYVFKGKGFARSVVFMKQIILTISNFDGIPYTDEQNSILKRFGSVFEQSYTRFLDLQKAEAQAREARIEAALEKVRSRALAMHRSEELQEVVTAVFDRLKDLDIETDAINLDVFNDDLKNAYLWTAVPGHNYSQEFRIPYNDIVVFRDIYEGLVAGKDLHSKVYNRQEKDEFLAFIFDHTDFRHMPEDRKAMLYATEASTVSVAYAKHIAIIAQRYREQLFSDEENRILIRFAKVFEQAYIRFLDLQKAEVLAQKAEEDLVKLKAEKKKTEETLTELKNTQSQLIQAEKMASLGELTAGIAHEIQNPLNFVNNFSEVSSELLEEMKELLAPDSYREGNRKQATEIMDDIKQNLEKILHHGKRADGIVKGMLQHSRSSSGQKELTDINNIADEYLRLAFHGLRAKDKSFNAELKTDFDNSIGKIEIVPQDVGRVLVNLLNNAFYAVNEKRKKGLNGYEPMITVSTKKTGDRIELSVKDNGNGIPKEALEKIFQPFFTTKPTGQGTGLGLSLSYDIINAHGGELRVKTNEGAGSEFIIQLPVN